MPMKYQQLIDDIIRMGYLKTPSIISAFRKYERKFFVQKDVAQYANVNQALPIGAGQTISQPLTVAIMLELLKPEKGNKILEIGGGSGWQTAILSEIVGKKGFVYAFEIIKSLAEFGSENLKKFNIKNATLKHKDVSKGYKNQAPYDRIISGAAFSEIPQELKNQLKVGGILVAPTKKDDIRKVTRILYKKFEEEIYPGFAFVPITTKNK
jgi:protein-L-isoaspartate(D-aspartate) O-methyltransferase